VDLRHQRLHLRHIARLLAAPFSTVARVLSRLGLGRLRNLEPKPPVQRPTGLRGGSGGRAAGQSDQLPEPGCGLALQDANERPVLTL
jgi:hypothetical protein